MGIALLLACTFLPRAAGASRLEEFAGWEGDDQRQGYGFVGAGISLPMNPRLSLSLSASASYLYYNYDSAGVRISVRSPGASLMTGIRLHGWRGSASLMAGGEARWEKRAVGEPGAAIRQRITSGAVVQTYDDLALARRWQATVFGVYVEAAEYWIGRAALRYQITNLELKRPTSFFAGVETVRQGNHASDAFQSGGFLEWNLVPQRISLGLHSGYKESWSPGWPHHPGGYVGAGFYRYF